MQRNAQLHVPSGGCSGRLFGVSMPQNDLKSFQKVLKWVPKGPIFEAKIEAKTELKRKTLQTLEYCKTC